MSSFKDRIKELRLENGMTQDEMAVKLSTTKGSISRYENGTRTPDIHFLKNAAIEFRVSMDWLSGNSDEKNLSIVQMYQVPELKEAAAKYIELGQIAYESGLSEEDIKQIFEIIKRSKRV